MQNETQPSAGLRSPCRDRIWLGAAGLLSLFVYLAMTRLSAQFNWGEGYAERPIPAYLVQYALLFALYAAAAYVVVKKIRADDRVALWIVVAGGLAFRLALLPSQQIQEDDVYRYLWDGKVFAHGINPFAYAPKEVNDFKYLQIREPDALQRRYGPRGVADLETLYRLKYETPTALMFMERINHPQVPTIYPPLAQYVFRLAHALRPDSIFVLRTVFLAIDLSALAFLVLALRRMNENPALCLLYFWSPLVIKETFNSTHLDVIGIAALCAYLYFRAARRWTAATVSLSLSVLGKLYPVVLLPLHLRDAARQEKDGWKRAIPRATTQAALFAVIVVVLYLPFVHDIGWRVFSGLQTFAAKWQRNDGIYALILHFFRALPGLSAEGSYFGIGGDLASLFAKITVTGIVFSALAHFWRHASSDNCDALRSAFILMALVFLLSPVQNPWYLCWVLPFLCFFPVRSWILLSGLIGLYYLSFYFDYQDLPGYIPWIVWLEYPPFFALLAWDLWRARAVSTQ